MSESYNGLTEYLRDRVLAQGIDLAGSPFGDNVVHASISRIIVYVSRGLLDSYQKGQPDALLADLQQLSESGQPLSVEWLEANVPTLHTIIDGAVDDTIRQIDRESSHWTWLFQQAGRR